MYKPRLNRRLRDYEAIYRGVLQRARHPVSITYEQFYDIIKNQECHYCESDLKMSKFRKKGCSTASCLDRKDCDIGYVNGNVVACCAKCNYGKGKWFTYEEWVEVGCTLKNIYKRKK